MHLYRAGRGRRLRGKTSMFTWFVSSHGLARQAREKIMQSLVILIVTILQLYMWVIIIGAIMSWLIAFNVVNTQNRIVEMVMDITYRLTEPVLGPIRRFLPNLGGLDISPVVLILGIIFLQNLLYEYLTPRVTYGGGF